MARADATTGARDARIMQTQALRLLFVFQTKGFDVFLKWTVLCNTVSETWETAYQQNGVMFWINSHVDMLHVLSSLLRFWFDDVSQEGRQSSKLELFLLFTRTTCALLHRSCGSIQKHRTIHTRDAIPGTVIRGQYRATRHDVKINGLNPTLVDGALF